MQVIRRTPIEIKASTPPGRTPYTYRFTVTLEDGTTRTVAGYAGTEQAARNEAIRRSGKMIEKGYPE